MHTANRKHTAPFLLYLQAVSSVVLLSTALSACQTTSQQANPVAQSVTPGSSFTVIKDFLIPSGDNAVYFQDDTLYPQGMLHANYPFCRFGTDSATASGQIIRAGAYTVEAVDYDEKAVGPGKIDVSETKIRLHGASPEGPSYYLDCMLPVLSYGARFVTPDEIQGAVGSYLDLKIAP